MAKRAKERKSNIVKTYLDGLIKLEFKDKIYYAIIKTSPTHYFYIQLDELDELVQDMKELKRLGIKGQVD